MSSRMDLLKELILLNEQRIIKLEGKVKRQNQAISDTYDLIMKLQSKIVKLEEKE